MIVNKGISVADYFKQKMQAKLQKPSEEIIENQPNESMEDQPEESIEDQQGETENVVKEKKKKKRKLEEDEVIEVLESAEDVEEKPVKKSKKKKQKESSDNDCEIVETIEKVEEEPPKKKKKSKKNPEEVSDVVEETTVAEKSKKKKKNKKEPEEEKVLAKTPEETTKSSKKKKNSTTKPSGEPERGANAVYSTNIIQIPSYVAQKLSSMSIHDFKNANLANVVGYGLTDNIEIKTVQTKIGQNTAGTDKYSLYNTDRLTTRQRQNPRKIFSKLKRTKKSIQVI